MNKSVRNQQSFGFFTNLTTKNNKKSNSIDPKSILKKVLLQTIICLILFFAIFSMKNIDTNTTNIITEEISYRLTQEFDFKSNYFMAVEWGKNLVTKGEATLAAINFGQTNQRSFVMPMEGNIVANFNEVNSTNSVPLEGIIIEGMAGNEVVAADDGVVIEANANQGLGHYIVIKHRGEYISVYKHLQESKVEVNGKVVKGEVIGISSERLLFEVWQRKEAIDPLQFLDFEEISL
ncbi:M23 family metallopeptidase [Alkaliphilus hydrothermalis]|uniref:Murein DD-endopeptidase MepM/ murein hydrolase activator NlpD n=1 Tax=Alkaliphilus hydrothermalis TaxID=1482730 RepID=A0ABS2NKY1_9FIRM|nr:M23 family metallopeptidase [Alkaliphilus hydrothermalis]MBM7613586.1 murein DD-endopeptidase MepM/ murein hydrolase activator NlpD [Alkaliphilus hydrothermalis]